LINRSYDALSTMSTQFTAVANGDPVELNFILDNSIESFKSSEFQSGKTADRQKGE